MLNEVKETQSDINNFVKKFLNKNNEMSDAKGYHKSLFTAMNPDAIANHFYEQGKADAMKDSVAKAKNVSMDPRQSFSNDNTSGPKVRVLSDELLQLLNLKLKINKLKFKNTKLWQLQEVVVEIVYLLTTANISIKLIRSSYSRIKDGHNNIYQT